MGWSGASDIFNVVAAVMQETDDGDVEVLDRLIGNLTDGDWDTQGESLEAFAAFPPAVEAFRRHGFHLPHCGSRHIYTSEHGYVGEFTCHLTCGHGPLHSDRGIHWNTSEG